MRLPCELIVKNGWEDATVLLGKPLHADLKIAPLPEFEWDALLDDCLHIIPDNAENAALRTEWQDWIGERPRTVADVEALGLWDRFRGSRGNGQSDPPSVLLLQLGRPRSARTQWSCSNQGPWHHLRMEEGRETRLESRVQNLALPLLWPRTLVGVILFRPATCASRR